MKNKIGVYICHCGGNISDYVDVAKVKDLVAGEQGVELVKTTLLACADSAQKEIVQDIEEKKLDAIVVASCSPKLHLTTFRAAAERAGLNPYNYVQVNIREQGSWAHSDTPGQATEKAVRLVRAGIARVRNSQALLPITISALNSTAVVGAGVSGMRAALELADMGTQVYVIENSHFVGGRVPQWGELFPTEENGEEIVARLIGEIKKRDNITLFTGTEIEAMSGCLGSIELTLKINPRYIAEDCDPVQLKKAVDKCPVEVGGEFDFLLSKRKAIYKPYEHAFPPGPVIDMDACTRCGECAAICPEAVNLDQKSETRRIKTGAIILTTGFDPYEPPEGEYGYGKIDHVVTLQQFKRMIELSPNKLVYAGRDIKNVAFIYCVGTRQKQGDNKYCARFCCTAAIHTALQIKKKYGSVRSFHLFRDIRTYGKQEILYEDSCKQGDIYLKFDENEPPNVEARDNSCLVKIKDLLTDHEELEINADIVVLVTGMVPRLGREINKILKVPIGRDQFYNEIHPKLRPVETVIKGVYIAGTCQGPKNISETVMSSLSAAAKAHSLLRTGEIALEPLIAEIDPETCEWCGKCSEVCLYDAITQTDYKGKTIAVVNEATCKGCGACTPVCPVDAVEIIGYKNVEIESMIDALASEVNL